MTRKHQQITSSERRSPAQWHQLIEAQSCSGLSQRAFCEQKQISYASFGYWRKKTRDGLGGAGDFVFIDPATDVPAAPVQPCGLHLRLDLGDGVVLELSRQ